MIKNLPANNKNFRLQQQRATLGAGDLTQAIKLPSDQSLEEWLAFHVVDFYNQINILYSNIIDYCTAETCPEMSAGKQFKYFWQDSDKHKKPVSLSAPDYVLKVMEWTENYFDDPKVFPLDVDVPFPPDFVQIVSTIFKRLFRIYAHMYNHHFDMLRTLGVEPHLNTSFRHFYLFIKEFNLMPEEQFAPLQFVIDCF